jgi:uncharacterized protein (TIGR03382 family)
MHMHKTKSLQLGRYLHFPKPWLLVTTTLLLQLCLGHLAHATDFYVDPIAGAPDNDGSASSPWSTLERVIADGRVGTVVQAGDNLWLRTGYHGDVVVRGGSYSPPINIAADAAATPTVRRIAFQQTLGWVVRNVVISPSFAQTYDKTTLVSVDAQSTDIEVHDCLLYSVADASTWNADQWINSASNGVQVSGARILVRNNVIRNVRFGITVTGAYARIEHNHIVNFSADGLRGLGDYGTYEYNEIKNIYVGASDGDSNHDDGFQSWSVGAEGVGTGEVVGVVLRGNLFLSTADPNHVLRTTMQGIGCFDGYFRDWIVENNIVITDHWHGISFYGMRGGRIVNNTVIDLNSVTPGPPWITVTDHKDGTPSHDVVVRNNLATRFVVSGNNVVSDHNLEISMDELDDSFVNPAVFDLHLVADAPARNAGSLELAPALDRDGISRPQGDAVDLGAYEWHDPSVQPLDGGEQLDAGRDSAVIPDQGLDDQNAPRDVDGIRDIDDSDQSHDADMSDARVNDSATADGGTESLDHGLGDHSVPRDVEGIEQWSDSATDATDTTLIAAGCNCATSVPASGIVMLLLLGGLLRRRRRT